MNTNWIELDLIIINLQKLLNFPPPSTVHIESIYIHLKYQHLHLVFKIL